MLTRRPEGFGGRPSAEGVYSDSVNLVLPSAGVMLRQLATNGRSEDAACGDSCVFLPDAGPGVDGERVSKQN